MSEIEGEGKEGRLRLRLVVVRLHGYSHCMPYGKVSLVMRLFPRDPGYEMRMCADAVAAAMTAVRRVEPSILSVACSRVCVGE